MLMFLEYRHLCFASSCALYSIMQLGCDKMTIMFFSLLLAFYKLFFSPEGLGVVTGAVFLIAMFLFIPFPFLTIWFEKGDYDFPHHEVSPVC